MICTVENCERSLYAKGLCNAHYLRQFIHGTIMADTPIRHVATRDTPLAERLLRGLPDRPPDGCWEWTRARNPQGYGKVCFAGKVLAAHRVAYETWVGPIPKGKHLLHSCDTPACCNPAHLSIGTHRDNMADMVTKGRSSRGERSGKAALAEEQALAIRSDLRPTVVVATEYGVSEEQVYRIRRGARWKHLL